MTILILLQPLFNTLPDFRKQYLQYVQPINVAFIYIRSMIGGCILKLTTVFEYTRKLPLKTAPRNHIQNIRDCLIFAVRIQTTTYE